MLWYSDDLEGFEFLSSNKRRISVELCVILRILLLLRILGCCRLLLRYIIWKCRNTWTLARMVSPFSRNNAGNRPSWSWGCSIACSFLKGPTPCCPFAHPDPTDQLLTSELALARSLRSDATAVLKTADARRWGDLGPVDKSESSRTELNLPRVVCVSLVKNKILNELRND